MRLKRPDTGEMLMYIRDLKLYILLAGAVFFGSMAAGYQYSQANPEAIKSIVEEIIKEFAQFKDYPLPVLMLRIFAQNTMLSFLALLLGLGFGVLSLAFLAYNGWIIGLVIYEVQQKLGLQYIIAGLVPHGIIEVPMILISVAIGLRLGVEVIRVILGSGNLRGEFKKGLIIYIFLVVPLLFIAALVEISITPLIIFISR
ncbi:MAG: stage II sporulation protein M [Methanocellales archaeon]